MREDAFAAFRTAVLEARKAMMQGSEQREHLPVWRMGSDHSATDHGRRRRSIQSWQRGVGGVAILLGWPDASEVPLMTNLRFRALGFVKNYGLSIGVVADAPPGAARSTSKRVRDDFFEQSQRMGYGGLVAVLSHKAGLQNRVDLAILTTCKLPVPNASCLS